MARPFDTEEIQTLAAFEGFPAISIYLPTERAGPETLQNAPRLKQRLREARTLLTAQGWRTSDADQLLAEADALLDDYPFWQYQQDGLALFLARDFFRKSPLPHPVTSQTILSHRFHLKPLLPGLTEDGDFFVLALSKNAVEFYQANRHGIEKLNLGGIPRSADEALRHVDPEKSLQHHTTQPVAQGGPSVMMHGHGAAREHEKDRTLEFLRQVERGLRPFLNRQQAPLVLAGVDAYLPLYRQVNTYGPLHDAVIEGNPEHLSPETVRQSGWLKVAPLFERAREEAVASIRQGLTNHQATADLETAVAACLHGRAAEGVVALDESHWGIFDESTATIQPRERQDPEGCDLTDLAAVKVLLHGGRMHPVPTRAEVPGDVPLAVRFRF